MKTRSFRSVTANNAWLYLAPALILLLIFFIWPLINAFLYAFTYEGKTTFDNFSYIFSDPEFWIALKNTLIFVVVVVPTALTISLSIAIAIHSKIKGAQVFETMYFMPYVTSVIAIGIVWSVMFHSDYGVINTIIKTLGGSRIPWLNSPKFALLSVIIFSVWKSLAFDIVILLTSLRTINPQLYRVADIDGAGSWMKFRRITLPLLSPTLTFLTLLGMIGAFKVYDNVVGLFGTTTAGPANSALTLVYYIFRSMYGRNDLHLAAAAAVVLFVVVLLFTILQRYLMKKIEKA
ncbi:carbohydrate ABC transporter permease [Paenibacillus cremeus]|uniref:Sugar ABC transporter permease n=1 Tax=Paenibacillus cremeus TaxID=2163881 RepID=A0A559KED7_9BACL|nr:sugar ABC transporter permease [Paenibacillus cremeus]TVY10479.1 sugar ABC transporter permease [Paenibacillus cremeus]